MSTPVSSKVINAPLKDLRSSLVYRTTKRTRRGKRQRSSSLLRSSFLAVRFSLAKPREIPSIRGTMLVDRTESKIIGLRGERSTTPSFSRFSASPERIETEDGSGCELDGRLEEWSIPDTRVDLTLLYLINYSVRYPILQFVPSHTSSPLYTPFALRIYVAASDRRAEIISSPFQNRE